MRSLFVSLWALFLGLALLMLGNGLQGTLLSLRASLSGFEIRVTGAVMACYYVGFLLGSWITPRLIRNVGHIRVFAALASVVSFAPLAHSVFVQPLSWALVRILAGMGMAGIFIIAESWLNGEATNANRGRLLSFYIIVCQLSMAGGQFLLGVADPRGFELFVLMSMLFSLAVVPIALSRRTAPAYVGGAPIGFGELARRVPLTVIGILLISLTYGAFYAMGAVYALRLGFADSQISAFMASAILGSVLLQWPLGMLSDRMDRRRLIAAACAGVAVVALVLALVGAGTPWLVYGLMFVYGGLSLPLYSLFLALAGDYLESDVLVGACSKIVLINGFGSAIGPLLVSVLMEWIALPAYMVCIALIHAATGFIVLNDMRRKGREAVEPAAHYTPVTTQTSFVATEMAGRVAGEP
jgi:MFS family permease